MYKIAIAAVALAVFAAPALTGGAQATPLATGVQAHMAGSQSAAPASTVVPVRHYYRYGYGQYSFGHGGGFGGHRSFGYGGGFRGHSFFGYGGSFHRSFRGGRSHYRGGGFGGSRSFGYGRGGYGGGRGRY